MQVRPSLFLNAAMSKTLYLAPRRTSAAAASRGRTNFQMSSGKSTTTQTITITITTVTEPSLPFNACRRPLCLLRTFLPLFISHSPAAHMCRSLGIQKSESKETSRTYNACRVGSMGDSREGRRERTQKWTDEKKGKILNKTREKTLRTEYTDRVDKIDRR